MNSFGFLMATFGSLLASAAVKATAVLDLVNFKERETLGRTVCLAGTNYNEFSQTIASSHLESTQTCPLDPGFQSWGTRRFSYPVLLEPKYLLDRHGLGPGPTQTLRTSVDFSEHKGRSQLDFRGMPG